MAVKNKSKANRNKKQTGCGQKGGSCDGVKMMGGYSSASSFGQELYGGPDDQTRGLNGAIATRSVGGYRNSSSSKNSKSKSNRKAKGGSALLDLALPAGLVFAQQRMTRSCKSKKNFSRRYRK